jgi:hypothetical protein
MRIPVLLAYSLLVFLVFLTPVQGAQTSESINSYGTIMYSTQPLALRRYAFDDLLKKMDAATLASLFDMCQAWSWDAQKIQQVRQIRPDFKALLYRCIKAITYQSVEWQMALDGNWLLKDVNGQLVYDTHYPSHYLVDIGNEQYQKWVANWIRENIDQYGFDGVMADNSLYAWANEIFWTASTQPTNPRTGTSWTNEEVRQALIQIHKEIKNAIGFRILWCNGIMEGYRFWRRYNEYMEFLNNSPMDGFGSEFLWHNGAWMSEAEWLDSLNFLVLVQDNFLKQNLNKMYGAACILDQLSTDCTKEQMLTYAFASTLLGIKTNQNYLALYTADISFTTQVIQPLFNIGIGVPINDYYVIPNSHVYARDFSNAKVLVNPTSNPYVINLQGTFKTLVGDLISEITMGSHTGIILTRL